jgi:hypothetical protein
VKWDANADRGTDAQPQLRALFPNAEQLRAMLDPESPHYGQSWSSELGWYSEADSGEAVIILRSTPPTGDDISEVLLRAKFADRGDLARRYLKDRTRLGRAIDRLAELFGRK